MLYDRDGSPTEKAGSIIGREVRVGVKEETNGGFSTYGGGLELIRDVIAQAMEAEGMRDERVSDLCETTALAAIGKLMLSDGLRVDFGRFDKPEETLVVQLREPGPRVIEVSAMRAVHSS